MVKSYYDYYKKLNLSPYTLDISKLDAHFERRAALFRYLGILPGYVKGKRVLEFGPGSGYNSLYCASLEPSKFILVECNTAGIESINKLFTNYPSLSKNIRVEQMLIEEFECSEVFDIVICEGVLPGQHDPQGILKKVSRFVAPGGILFISCGTYIGHFSENLRRLFAQIIIDPEAAIESNVKILTSVFSTHLDTIKGMTRNKEDWIVDNLLCTAVVCEDINTPEAIETLDESFDIFGSSPKMFSDWRWYKNLCNGNENYNKLAIDQYWQMAHNFLDYRNFSESRLPQENKQLSDLCLIFRKKLRQFETRRDLDLMEDFHQILDQIICSIDKFSKEQGDAFREAKSILNNYPIDSHALTNSILFGPFFGQPIHCLSFTRKQSKLEQVKKL